MWKNIDVLGLALRVEVDATRVAPKRLVELVC